VEINYAVLMPPPKRSVRKLQVMILGGVGFVALTAIIVAVVLVRAYAPQAATLGPGDSSAVATAAIPDPTAGASQPSGTLQPAATKAAPEKPAPKKGKRVGRAGKRGVAKAASEKPAAARKGRGDDELKRLLGI
jgi:hypothetical protein